MERAVMESDRVDTSALFRPLHAELIGLLRGLPADAWHRPTSAGPWRVRDVAAHMVDLDLRRISIERDAHFPPPPAHAIESQADLVTYLAALNGEWASAARRISARLLTELLESLGTEVAALMESADLSRDATFPVTWAGQARSPMWLDVAREYTERWHHQDQIREAAGVPPLDAPHWLRPVLAVSALALPPALAGTDAADGTRIEVHATGASAMTWSLTRTAGAWRLSTTAASASPACRVTAPDLVLARLLLHRLDAAAAAQQISVEGDTALGEPLLRARAVVV
jgi:hypothetical protein